MQRIFQRTPFFIAISLLVYMPFHVFLAQSLSLLAGGLDAWKIGKDVLLALAVVFAICMVWFYGRATRLFSVLICLSVLYVGLHVLLWLTHPGLYRPSAELGIIYNGRLAGFLLLGYSAALLLRERLDMRLVLKLVLIASTIVAALGVLQFFLPKDLLTHFGYGLDRGTRPAFFIDSTASFPRIMSTLREPNALGAYLIMPITLLVALLLRTKNHAKRLVLGGSLLLHALAVFLTFSRSAWLGAVMAVGLVLWWQFRPWLLRQVRRLWPLLIGTTLLLGFGAYAQRNNALLRSYITHSTPEKVQDLDSNDYHWLYVRQGLEGIRQEPLGHGPGTAGIVSIQNPKGGFLTENYYVQIGYEVGVIGLLLFLALNTAAYWKLSTHRDNLSIALLASFWAYVLVNMLLHIWSNEAVVAQWWLLAGFALLNAHEHSKPSGAINSQ